MRTEFKAVNQKEIEFELTVRMKLDDWKILKSQLEAERNSRYPAWHIVNVIRDMVKQANAHWVDEGDQTFDE